MKKSFRASKPLNLVTIFDNLDPQIYLGNVVASKTICIHDQSHI